MINTTHGHLNIGVELEAVSLLGCLGQARNTFSPKHDVFLQIHCRIVLSDIMLHQISTSASPSNLIRCAISAQWVIFSFLSPLSHTIS